jgi:hypothetical protein
MWEMFTGQRPYGNMKQQQLVEEVVMRGLRPKFPSHAPPAYVALAQACWSGSPQARPTFEESLGTLNQMLQAVDDREIGSMASGSFGSMSEAVEYMPGFGTTTPQPPPGRMQQQQQQPGQQQPPRHYQQPPLPPSRAVAGGSGAGRQFVASAGVAPR